MTGTLLDEEMLPSDHMDSAYYQAEAELEAELEATCGVLDDHYAATWSRTQYYCEGVLFAVFGVVGLVGNVVSILVLASSKKMRKHAFNQLLIALAVFDVVFILVSVPVYSISLFEGMLEYEVSAW